MKKFDFVRRQLDKIFGWMGFGFGFGIGIGLLFSSVAFLGLNFVYFAFI